MNITIEMALGAAGALVALAGFAWGIVTWVISQFSSRDAAISRVRDEIASHKLHAAETFATRAGVTESLDRVFAAIDKLTGRVDELLRIERRKED